MHVEETPRPPLRTEVLAGLTTFFTMAYIVVVNPAILADEATGMPFNGVLTATVLLCFSMTLLMGLFAKLPYAVAPGMGINAFFAYTLVIGRGIPWQTALGVVFWAGVIFVLASVTPVRELIVRAIPKSLRIAVAAGIGLFLTLIGLQNGGVVVDHPATLMTFGGLSFESGMTLLGAGVILLLLVKFKSPFAFLAGIFIVTVVALGIGRVDRPDQLVSLPDFNSAMFQLDIWGALSLAIAPSIVSILFTDLFDSVSTFVGVSRATGLVDEEGNPKRMREGLIVDAFSTFFAGIFGTSSGTAYIESAAGIEVGGRTGRTAVVTALCFLPCLFLAPLAGMIPAYATAPVLIVIGALMFRPISELTSQKMEDLIPAFLTIALIPLTFSITQGILWGFISHTALYLIVGRQREIPVTLYVISVLSVGLLILESAYVS